MVFRKRSMTGVGCSRSARRQGRRRRNIGLAGLCLMVMFAVGPFSVFARTHEKVPNRVTPLGTATKSSPSTDVPAAQLPPVTSTLTPVFAAPAPPPPPSVATTTTTPPLAPVSSSPRPLDYSPPETPPEDPPVVSDAIDDWYSRALARIQNAIADQALPDEGVKPLPDGYDWQLGPVIQSGNNAGGMRAATTWGVVFVDRGTTEDPARSNTRVQVRASKTWLLSKSTGRWVLVADGTQPGRAFREDFSGDVSWPMNVRGELEGVSGRLDFGTGRHAWHFWSPRGVLDPNDIAGMYGSFQARLILDNPVGPDDRSFWSQRLLVGAGIDYWADLNAAWPNNLGASIGRFKLAGNDWRYYTTTTLTPEQLQLNPPPE